MDVISQIDEWIQQILHVPRMYGTCNESIELQILTLLEVKYLIFNPDKTRENPRYIIGLYNKCLRKKYPNQNLPLFAIVLDDKIFIEDLKNVVAEFNKELHG